MNVDPSSRSARHAPLSRDRIELAERLAAEAGETWTELDLDGQERWYERAKASKGRG